MSREVAASSGVSTLAHATRPVPVPIVDHIGLAAGKLPVAVGRIVAKPGLGVKRVAGEGSPS